MDLAQISSSGLRCVRELCVRLSWQGLSGPRLAGSESKISLTSLIESAKEKATQEENCSYRPMANMGQRDSHWPDGRLPTLLASSVLLADLGGGSVRVLLA